MKTDQQTPWNRIKALGKSHLNREVTTAFGMLFFAFLQIQAQFLGNAWFLILPVFVVLIVRNYYRKRNDGSYSSNTDSDSSFQQHNHSNMNHPGWDNQLHWNDRPENNGQMHHHHHHHQHMEDTIKDQTSWNNQSDWNNNSGNTDSGYPGDSGNSSSFDSNNTVTNGD